MEPMFGKPRPDTTEDEQECLINMAYMDRFHRPLSAFRGGPWGQNAQPERYWSHHPSQQHFLRNLGANTIFPMPRICTPSEAAAFSDRFRHEIARSWVELEELFYRSFDVVMRYVPQAKNRYNPDGESELWHQIQNAWHDARSHDLLRAEFGASDWPETPTASIRLYDLNSIGEWQSPAVPGYKLPIFNFTPEIQSNRQKKRSKQSGSAGQQPDRWSAYNQFVTSHRVALQVPMLSEWEISKDLAVLYLILERSVNPPMHWALFDWEASHFGRSTGLVVPPYSEGRFMVFPHAEEPGYAFSGGNAAFEPVAFPSSDLRGEDFRRSKTLWCQHRLGFDLDSPNGKESPQQRGWLQEFRDTGRILGWGDGMVVLQSQLTIIQFCLSFMKRVLGHPCELPEYSKPVPLQSILRTISPPFPPCSPWATPKERDRSREAWRAEYLRSNYKISKFSFPNFPHTAATLPPFFDDMDRLNNLESEELIQQDNECRVANLQDILGSNAHHDDNHHFARLHFDWGGEFTWFPILLGSMLFSMDSLEDFLGYPAEFRNKFFEASQLHYGLVKQEGTADYLPHVESQNIFAKKELANDILRHRLRLELFVVAMLGVLDQLMLDCRLRGIERRDVADVMRDEFAKRSITLLKFHLRWFTDLTMKILIDQGFLQASRDLRDHFRRATTNEEILRRGADTLRTSSGGPRKRGRPASKEAEKWALPKGLVSAQRISFSRRLSAQKAWALETSSEAKELIGEASLYGVLTALCDQGLRADKAAGWLGYDFMGAQLPTFIRVLYGERRVPESDQANFYVHEENTILDNICRVLYNMARLLQSLEMRYPLSTRRYDYRGRRAQAAKDHTQGGRFIQKFDAMAFDEHISADVLDNIHHLLGIRYADDETDQVDNATARTWLTRFRDELGKWLSEDRRAAPYQIDQYINRTPNYTGSASDPIQLKTLLGSVSTLSEEGKRRQATRAEEERRKARLESVLNCLTAAPRKSVPVPRDRAKIHDDLLQGNKTPQVTSSSLPGSLPGRQWRTVAETFEATSKHWRLSPIAWQDWCNLITRLGFSMEATGGSVFRFERTEASLLPEGNVARAHIHYPHQPGNNAEVRPDQIRNWCRQFAELGVTYDNIKEAYGKEGRNAAGPRAQPGARVARVLSGRASLPDASSDMRDGRGEDQEEEDDETGVEDFEVHEDGEAEGEEGERESGDKRDSGESPAGPDRKRRRDDGYSMDEFVERVRKRAKMEGKVRGADSEEELGEPREFDEEDMPEKEL